MMKDVNVLMVGVGGYGVILASDGMAEVGMENGYDVKKTDSLGMSQRGGSVVSHVRWGTQVFSPLIKKGEVDFLVGLEQLEAARWAYFLKPDGVAIVADVVVIPISAVTGKIPYPSWDKIKGIILQYTDEIHLVPAIRIAQEADNPRAVNMVMLGFLSAFLELEPKAWTDVMRRRLPPKFVESSVDAFHRGLQEANSIIEAREIKK
jgi:indolepyruvate ferredoxin oxidoreductase beta subunit